MSIASQISRLQQAKVDIKAAIEAKGVTVSSSLKLDGYASCISQIGGGGQVVMPKGMRFCYSTLSVFPGWVENADWGNVTDLQNCFSNCSNLRSITLSGLNNVEVMAGCFQYCTYLSSVTLPELSKVKTLQYCFFSCSRLSSITLSGLSNVTSLHSCFSYCSNLTSVTLSGLSTKLNYMGYCFCNCINLSSITLPELSYVTNLTCCFSGCTRLKSIVLSGLGNVSNMSGCFSVCTSLQSITLSGLSVLTTIDNCFSSCSSLTELIVDSWGTKVTKLTAWGISYCTRLSHDSLINLISALYTTSVSRACTIGTTNLAKLTAEEIAVATAKGWNLQ